MRRAELIERAKDWLRANNWSILSSNFRLNATKYVDIIAYPLGPDGLAARFPTLEPRLVVFFRVQQAHKTPPSGESWRRTAAAAALWVLRYGGSNDRYRCDRLVLTTAEVPKVEHIVEDYKA